MRFGAINSEYPMLIGLLAAVMQHAAVRIAVVKLPCKVKENYASAETDAKYMLDLYAGLLIECDSSFNYPIDRDTAPET